MTPEDSVLKIRRSIHIKAPPALVWNQFTSAERTDRWWGFRSGDPEAGTARGQWLEIYEPEAGGRIEMSVLMDGARVRYGGTIATFAPGAELTFTNDGLPNRGWQAPTLITLRLTPALGGTLVELFHYGFERTGADAATDHAAYEQGWGMTQLMALRSICEP
jgi:uncharacterized protein YndB with AHSA1/START domain